jgi:septum formation protein
VINNNNQCYQGLKFEVVTSLFEENLDPLSYKDPADFVIETALHKVQEVAARLQHDNPPPGLIIGADTVVVMDGHIHGKPSSHEDAFSMLQK